MRRSAFITASCLLAGVFAAAGCETHPAANYVPLAQAGFSSGAVEQLKKLNLSDTEVPQVAKLKGLGLSDDMCLAMVREARVHQHAFSGGDSASNLIGAGYSEQDVLAMAHSDQLDSISTEAITLKLIGLSQPTVHLLVSRHLQGLPTLSSEAIGRLKNTGLTEKQILERVEQGMTDEQAEAEAASREAKRNHANTDFVRTRARRR
jgi:hypothetical protein